MSLRDDVTGGLLAIGFFFALGVSIGFTIVGKLDLALLALGWAVVVQPSAVRP